MNYRSKEDRDRQLAELLTPEERGQNQRELEERNALVSAISAETQRSIGALLGESVLDTLCKRDHGWSVPLPSPGK